MNVREIKDTDGRDWRFHEYPNFHEFLDDCLDPDLHKTQGGYGEHESLSSFDKENTQKWDLGAGWDGSLKLLASGWPEGVEQANKLSADILGVRGQFCEEDVLFYDTTGVICDPGLLIEGVPECMAHLEKVDCPGEGEVVDICVNIRGSAGITANQLAMRGAAHVALLIALEDAGYKCTITVISAGMSSVGLGPAVQVLNTDYAIDRDLLAYVIAHPAFMRRQTFRMLEQFPREWRKRGGVGVPGGYGRPADCQKYKEEFDIYSPAFHLDDCDFTDVPGAVAWVNRRLEEFSAKVSV